jgi:hypothetical protein
MVSITAIGARWQGPRPIDNTPTASAVRDHRFEAEPALAQASCCAATTPLGEIMQRDNQPNAAAAARTYALETLGIENARILGIEAVGVSDPNSAQSWLPMKITYTSGKQPTATELATLQAKATQIGRLQIQNGADVSGVALTVIGTGTAFQGARLALYRATLDGGFKRAGAEMTAKLAARQANTVGAVTLVNGVRVVASDNLGKLNAATHEFNAMFIRTYGIKTVVVR